MDNKKNIIQCKGQRRHGGVFTLGPVRWTQCKNAAVISLEVVQEGKTETMPACMICWKEGIENNIQINKVTPI